VSHDLSKKEWLRFFEELNRCAITHVILQGGEPFCREDLRELIKGIVRNRMRFNILSNGTLISHDMAAFIASTGRCNAVQVSIDGSTPITHDVFRGEGSFLKVMDGLRILLRHQIPVDVRVTIHRQNVSELESVAALLLEDIGLPRFSTNAASYMGLCRFNTEQIELTVKERAHAMEVLLKLKKKYNGRIAATAGPLGEAETWLSMVKSSGEKRMECISGQGYLSGCGVGKDKIAVRADGVLVPCIQLGHIALGQINKQSLQEVWLNHPTLNRLRDRWNIPLSDFEFCKGCEHIDSCKGGCPGLAYTILGDEYHPSPDDCLRRYLARGGTLPDIELSFTESNSHGRKCG
jgi:SynChlorMet cassette radical SAM/SPASM protein ScmE